VPSKLYGILKTEAPVLFVGPRTPTRVKRSAGSVVGRYCRSPPMGRRLLRPWMSLERSREATVRRRGGYRQDREYLVGAPVLSLAVWSRLKRLFSARGERPIGDRLEEPGGTGTGTLRRKQGYRHEGGRVLPK